MAATSTPMPSGSPARLPSSTSSSPSASASLPSHMRAWTYKTYGGGAASLELAANVAVPKAGKGEVVVKVHAVGMNPADWKIQSGMARPVLPSRLPWFPGSDVAGEVVQVGEDADGFVVGDQVFGMTDLWKGGGFAEYALLAKARMAQRPRTVSAVVAAALAMPSSTALQALRDYAHIDVAHLTQENSQVEEEAAGSHGRNAAKAGTGIRVLVANASGGVGHYAVQLAKLAGAHVTATCGARNLSFVKGLGADEVIDYKSDAGKQLRSASGEPYDFVIDAAEGNTWGTVRRVLAPKGRWVHISPDMVTLARGLWHTIMPWRSQRLVTVMQEPKAEDFAFLARLAEDGRLKTHIEAEIDFEHLPEAWKRSMDGHVVGKLVVVMPPEK